MSEENPISIAQFIPRYPDREDENLAYGLARKKEFQDLRFRSF